jgi:hypothetical protein
MSGHGRGAAHRCDRGQRDGEQFDETLRLGNSGEVQRLVGRAAGFEPQQPPERLLDAVANGLLVAADLK